MGLSVVDFLYCDVRGIAHRIHVDRKEIFDSRIDFFYRLDLTFDSPQLKVSSFFFLIFDRQLASTLSRPEKIRPFKKKKKRKKNGTINSVALNLGNDIFVVYSR